MLCINSYPQEYIDECRSHIAAQLAAYDHLVTTARQQSATGAAPLNSAIGSFEPIFFNNLVLQLDWLFVHRSRALELKDGNPVNEVRVLCNSLMNNGGKMSADKSIKLNPSKSVLKYNVGDEIKVSETDFTRLSEAFFAEIERKYLETEAVPT